MEIVDVLSMNGIENYPKQAKFKKKFLRSHRHIFQGFLPQGQGGHTFFKGGGATAKTLLIL